MTGTVSTAGGQQRAGQHWLSGVRVARGIEPELVGATGPGAPRYLGSGVAWAVPACRAPVLPGAWAAVSGDTLCPTLKTASLPEVPCTHSLASPLLRLRFSVWDMDAQGSSRQCGKEDSGWPRGGRAEERGEIANAGSHASAPAPHSSKGPGRGGSPHSCDRKGRNPALKACRRLSCGLKLRAASVSLENTSRPGLGGKGGHRGRGTLRPAASTHSCAGPWRAASEAQSGREGGGGENPRVGAGVSLFR